MDRPIVAVVMAGGTGTRLYPASRGDRPKQFLSLDGERSLLARTVERAGFADRRVVVVGPDQADRAREAVSDADVLVEPAPKDTGPALASATARVRDEYANGPEPVVVSLPSDHRIRGPFERLARRAARVAVETRGLVTVGIDPDRAATGYGYIEGGRREDGYAPVERFHEKPDADAAEQLIEAGALWNAGIFAWLPSAFLSAARESPLSPLVDALDDGRPEEGYTAVDPVSVDYAVMERTDHAFVVPAPADLEWDDLGTWDTVGRVLDADPEGNAVLGEALTVDAADNVIASDDKHVTAVGVSDLAIVSFDDRVLVVPREEAERVREAVERLRDEGLF